MKFKIVIGAALLASLFAAGCAFGALKAGPGNTPFWVEIDDPQQIDEQVARLLADHASVIALRMPDGSGVQAKATVAKLKHEAPETPVLMYTWASRNLKGKRGSSGIMDWLDQDGGRMHIHGPNGKTLGVFGDVTLPEYRIKAAASIAAAVSRGGYDGVVLDLAIRTPQYRPARLAQICSRDATFCSRYAQGMDATFDAIRDALGNRAILYNGIWNFGEGTVADQQQLLNHADAAAIEFFGADPKSPIHSFNQDILPFLQVMTQISADKKVLVFGRGSWEYMDYAEDYARQRYLYCAYLLAARANTYFKYHSTFQTDSPNGRSGGLSIYADWAADIGTPVKAYSNAAGLYSRQFMHGLVVVAPEDGLGGAYDLPHAMYSPEGDKYEGRVNLRPKEGLLLLDNKQANVDDQRYLDLKLLSDWPSASPLDAKSGPGISLRAGAPLGSHDMLIDAVRSLHPHNTLQLLVQAGDQSTQMQLVAEVDDPSHNTEFAILDLKAQGASVEKGHTQAIGFRSSTLRKAALPVVDVTELTPGTWQTINLDGHSLFAKSNLVFKRWDYVRFNGALKIKTVKLLN